MGTPHNVKVKPATPLPWLSQINSNMQGSALLISDADKKPVVYVEATGPILCAGGRYSISDADFRTSAYIAHAANAYPKLVEALAEIARHAIANTHGSFNVSADRIRAARALLSELGESN